MNYGKKGVEEHLKNTVPTSERYKNKIVITFAKLFVLALIFVAAAGTAAGIGVARGIINNAPDLEPEDVEPDGFMTTVYDA